MCSSHALRTRSCGSSRLLDATGGMSRSCLYPVERIETTSPVVCSANNGLSGDVEAGNDVQQTVKLEIESIIEAMPQTHISGGSSAELSLPLLKVSLTPTQVLRKRRLTCWAMALNLMLSVV